MGKLDLFLCTGRPCEVLSKSYNITEQVSQLMQRDRATCCQPKFGKQMKNNYNDLQGHW